MKKEKMYLEDNKKNVPGLHPGLLDLMRVLGKQAHCVSKTLVASEPCTSGHPTSRYHRSCSPVQEVRRSEAGRRSETGRQSSQWSQASYESHQDNPSLNCDRESHYQNIEARYLAIKNQVLDYSPPPSCERDRTRRNRYSLDSQEAELVDVSTQMSAQKRVSIQNENDTFGTEGFSSNSPCALDDFICSAELTKIKQLLKKGDKETSKILREMLCVLREIGQQCDFSVADVIRSSYESEADAWLGDETVRSFNPPPVLWDDQSKEYVDSSGDEDTYQPQKHQNLPIPMVSREDSIQSDEPSYVPRAPTLSASPESDYTRNVNKNEMTVQELFELVQQVTDVIIFEMCNEVCWKSVCSKTIERAIKAGDLFSTKTPGITCKAKCSKNVSCSNKIPMPEEYLDEPFRTSSPSPDEESTKRSIRSSSGKSSKASDMLLEEPQVADKYVATAPQPDTAESTSNRVKMDRGRHTTESPTNRLKTYRGRRSAESPTNRSRKDIHKSTGELPTSRSKADRDRHRSESPTNRSVTDRGKYRSKSPMTRPVTDRRRPRSESPTKRSVTDRGRPRSESPTNRSKSDTDRHKTELPASRSGTDRGRYRSASPKNRSMADKDRLRSKSPMNVSLTDRSTSPTKSHMNCAIPHGDKYLESPPKSPIRDRVRNAESPTNRSATDRRRQNYESPTDRFMAERRRQKQSPTNQSTTDRHRRSPDSPTGRFMADRSRRTESPSNLSTTDKRRRSLESTTNRFMTGRGKSTESRSTTGILRGRSESPTNRPIRDRGRHAESPNTDRRRRDWESSSNRPVTGRGRHTESPTTSRRRRSSESSTNRPIKGRGRPTESSSDHFMSRANESSTNERRMVKANASSHSTDYADRTEESSRDPSRLNQPSSYVDSSREDHTTGKMSGPPPESNRKKGHHSKKGGLSKDQKKKLKKYALIAIPIIGLLIGGTYLILRHNIVNVDCMDM